MTYKKEFELGMRASGTWWRCKLCLILGISSLYDRGVRMAFESPEYKESNVQSTFALATNTQTQRL
jgi:hypothetical protein